MKNSLRLVALSMLVFCAHPAVTNAQDCSKCFRLITVTGEAEVRVVPNEVLLSFGIETSAKTLALAKAEHDARGKKVHALLRNSGIDSKDIRTSNLSMGPEYEEIKDKRVQVGYQVKQSLAVLLRDLTKYESLVTGLLEAGITRVDDVQFQVSDMSKHRAEARVLAIRAAREKAAALAGELNQKIGKPRNISEEDPGGYGGRANVTNFAGANYVPPSDATIAGGQLVIRARIAVEFELLD